MTKNNKMPSIDGKNNFALLREKILGQSGKEYWRSIEEYVDSPEFADYVKYEHPEQADTWALSAPSASEIICAVEVAQILFTSKKEKG